MQILLASGWIRTEDSCYKSRVRAIMHANSSRVGLVRVACLLSRMRLLRTLMAGVTLLATAAATIDADLSPFPLEMQLALRSKHGLEPGQPPKRGGSGRKQFQLADDVHILLQHVHAGVPLKQISAGGRTGTAIRDRHNKHLQVLPGYGTFVAASHEASKSVSVVVSPPPRASATTGNAVQEQLQQRLHSCDISLPDGVEQDLVRLHCEEVRAQTKAPWAIEEDARLLEAFFAEEAISHVTVTNRSRSAKRNRLCALKRQLRCTRCAFHSAQCDPEAPAIELQYDAWTPIAADRAIPREAEIDWLRGVARAPASWELRLGSSCFCLYDWDQRQPMGMEAADTFVLEDVRPDMTIWALQQHITRWMRSSASPAMAHGVDHDTVRLAILSENATPTDSMQAESNRTYYVVCSTQCTIVAVTACLGPRRSWPATCARVRNAT